MPWGKGTVVRARKDTYFSRATQQGVRITILCSDAAAPLATLPCNGAQYLPT